MNAADFLRTLWGDRPPGLIELWTKDGKKSQYLRSPTGAGVVATPGRSDVYTGVALAHQDPGRSKRAKATERIALAGLWLDIDVCGGPDRKTGVAPNRNAALAIAHTITAPTLVVDSGYGLHAWWLFDTPWAFRTIAEQQQAQLAAAQWYHLHRQAAQAKGWTIDHTHDLARLLRIPGTMNGKDPARPREVTLQIESPRRHPLERLLEHAAHAGTVDLTAATRAQVSFTLRSNAELEAEVLDALELNAPDFYETLMHGDTVDTTGWKDTSASAWDLSIATQAAQAGWEDQRIADMLVWHRRTHYPDSPKIGRVDYLRRTIGLARGRAKRGAAADTLRELAGRAAA